MKDNKIFFSQKKKKSEWFRKKKEEKKTHSGDEPEERATAWFSDHFSELTAKIQITGMSQFKMIC